MAFLDLKTRFRYNGVHSRIKYVDAIRCLKYCTLIIYENKKYIIKSVLL